MAFERMIRATIFRALIDGGSCLQDLEQEVEDSSGKRAFSHDLHEWVEVEVEVEVEVGVRAEVADRRFLPSPSLL